MGRLPVVDVVAEERAEVVDVEAVVLPLKDDCSGAPVHHGGVQHPGQTCGGRGASQVGTKHITGICEPCLNCIEGPVKGNLRKDQYLFCVIQHI